MNDQKNNNTTDLAIQGEYEEYLKTYNLKQKELSEQKELIDKRFNEYQNNLNELKELKDILKKKKREFVEMSSDVRKLHQMHRNDKEK